MAQVVQPPGNGDRMDTNELLITLLTELIAIAATIAYGIWLEKHK